MSLPSETTVLIVGAGPVGMALAVSCALHRIDAVIVDNRLEMQNTSRAAWVHARTLEVGLSFCGFLPRIHLTRNFQVLESIGVSDEMLRRGKISKNATVRAGHSVLFNIDFGTLPDTPYNFTLIIPQNDTEQIIVERLKELGRDVVRPKKVVGLRQSADGYNEVTFESGEVVKARYVVGADGSRSVVCTLPSDVSFEHRLISHTDI